MAKTITLKVLQSAYNDKTGETALLIMVADARECDRSIFVCRHLDNTNHPGHCRVAYYKDMLEMGTDSMGARWRSDTTLLMTADKPAVIMEALQMEVARLLKELEESEKIDSSVYYVINSAGPVTNDNPVIGDVSYPVTYQGVNVTHNGIELTTNIEV